jgi:acetoacetyl-CoA synthetase
VARGLRSLGVRRGDRVAAVLLNVPEAVIGLLAAASLGAIWSSCSPDFGVPSVVDRFAQIEPTVLIACDGYVYAGREFLLAPIRRRPRIKMPWPIPACPATSAGSGEPDARRLLKEIALSQRGGRVVGA